MAYNNVNEQSGVANAQSIPQKAASGFQSEQPMNTAHHTSGLHSHQTQHPASSEAEEKLEKEGHLPGLSEVQHDTEKDMRQPGEDDAAGNKIHHKGILKKMLHWEHNGMNAD